MNNRRFLSFFCLLALFFTGFGPALAKDPLRIAVVGPFTGSLAQYGEMQKVGARMAANILNDIGSRVAIKIEFYDDACEPKQAVAVANKIVNDGIRHVVGHLCSGSTQPASDIYEDEGVLMITPASTNPAITERGLRMIFRTIGTDSQQGPTAGRFLLEHVKPSRLAILHDKQQYGQGIAKSAQATVEQGGLMPVLFEGVNSGQTDFSALITKMKGLRVDFVYYGGYHPELGLILRQSREQGFDAGFMGPEGVANKDLTGIAGKSAEGLFVTLPPDFSAVKENDWLIEQFKRRGWDYSGPFVLTTYAAVQVIASAVQMAKGDTEPSKLAAYMRSNRFNTPIGKLAFQRSGDLKDFKFDVFTWHADSSKSLVNWQ